MNFKKGSSRILELAEKYAKKGKFQEAIAEYNKLITGDAARDINVRSLIGDLLAKSGQKEEAIKEFQKIASFYEKKSLYSQTMAIYKKIDRLNPENPESAMKLADLYYNKGFTTEAKAKYLKIAKMLADNSRIKEAISLYEKVLKFDKEDYEAKLTLATLYSKEGLIDKAVEELNEIAEFKIRNKELNEAKEILTQAKMLKEDNLRTLSNLIDIFKRENKKKETLDLINDVLEKDINNLKALKILGNLYFEEQNLKKAEEIFAQMISLRSKDVETRVKLGRIYIHQDKLDQAFDLYEPLVDTLIRRQKEEKAIGLLGLILATKKAHFPTLEKLASIYKSNNQKKNLEIVYRIMLEESRKKNLSEKSLSVLKELVNLSPQDEELYSEYRKMKKELGVLEEEKEAGKPPLFLDEAKEIIKRDLAKADLYIEQGLIKNARRILEHLKLKYPEVPIINQKIATLTKIRSEVKEEEISHRIERISIKENQLSGFFSEKGAFEEKLSAADIFAETDIIPIVPQEGGERKYYDLTQKINEEIEVIQAILYQQLKGDTTVVEKELTDIVTEFRRRVEEKIDKEDYESRYNLGVVYLEQGLIEEAVEEFKLASKDKKRIAECYSSISFCFRKKKKFEEAVKWIEKALEVVRKDSSQFFGLKYELASLYEEMGKRREASSLYNEIKRWNGKYRDVAQRIKKLGKNFMRKF